MNTKANLVSLIGGWFACGVALGNAQETTSVQEPASKPVELSPFVVDTSRDRGYMASNTAAGSRLNTSLRDTPSSISVFSTHFLEDWAITDIGELMEYTVNSEMDTSAHRSTSTQNETINADRLTRRIMVRGLMAGQALDFFHSITPIDVYRIARYEDSRGPNSILFGVGSPGGVLNQSSITAVTSRNNGSIRHSFGSWDRNRTEFNINRVLMSDKLAVAVAALHQENGGWRNFDYKDSDRVYGAVTVRPNSRLTLRAMGEKGSEKNAVVTSFPQTDEVLAWYDNREALGVDAVTVTPTNANPTAAMRSVGIVARNGNRVGNNRRTTFIENDGTVFDAIGTFITGSYNDSSVRAPDGTPGITASPLRLTDTSFYPHFNNAGGPGMNRVQRFNNHTFTADWQVSENLFLNLGHNYQSTDAVVHLMLGFRPMLRGDANRTLGVGGVTNPYAGELYFDGEWQRDQHVGTYRETRASLLYNLNTDSKWLGNHRIAVLASRAEEYSHRAAAWMALAGRPFNNTVWQANNRILVRNYLTPGNYSTYRAGDWRAVPSTITLHGVDYETAWVNSAAGALNNAAELETDSLLGVLQSSFLDDRLVTTIGFRRDDVDLYSFGYRDDPIIGDVVDPDPAKRTLDKLSGKTNTLGAVYHVNDWLSVIANRSSSIGIPRFSQLILPDGRIPPAPEGNGEDFGLGFDLLDGRLAVRTVYFTSSERGRTEAFGVPAFYGNRNRRIMDAFAEVLVGPGLPYSQGEWDAIYRNYAPPLGGGTADVDSEGYEMSVVANLTSRWRLTMNYSYTDSGHSALLAESIPWYGFTLNDRNLLVQGVSQNQDGQFVVDPGAFTADGTVAAWIDLANQHPDAGLGTLTTSFGTSIAEEIFDMINDVNQRKEDEEKRWGLRPHKISLFTAYDFTSGRLKGLTVGGGWKYRSANVIGANSSGDEITGRSISSEDLMVRYVWNPKSVPGRFAFQINVNNVFDRTDFIPTRLAISSDAPDGFQLPGGRGLAYSRLDLVAPREIRITTTYSF